MQPVSDPKLIEKGLNINGLWIKSEIRSGIDVPASDDAIAQASDATLTDAEAIALASDTDTAWRPISMRLISVVTGGLQKASNTAWSTSMKTLSPMQQPFGRTKQSGYGREGSRYGFGDYWEIKYLCMGGSNQ